jgi:hypothetical protein
MYGNANEEDLIYGRCDACNKKVKLKDLIEKYSEVDKITWFDGTLKPKLYLYCGDCYGRL